MLMGNRINLPNAYATTAYAAAVVSVLHARIVVIKNVPATFAWLAREQRERK